MQLALFLFLFLKYVLQKSMQLFFEVISKLSFIHARFNIIKMQAYASIRVFELIYIINSKVY